MSLKMSYGLRDETSNQLLQHSKEHQVWLPHMLKYSAWLGYWCRNLVFYLDQRFIVLLQKIYHISNFVTFNVGTGHYLELFNRLPVLIQLTCEYELKNTIEMEDDYYRATFYCIQPLNWHRNTSFNRLKILTPVIYMGQEFALAHYDNSWGFFEIF